MFKVIYSLEEIKKVLDKHKKKKAHYYLRVGPYTNAKFLSIDDYNPNIYYLNTEDVLTLIQEYPNLTPGDQYTKEKAFYYMLRKYIDA